MPSQQRREELLRLRRAFEAEADQYHDLSLSIFYFTQELPLTGRKFRSPNHTIMLWQYYGQLDNSDDTIERLVRNLNSSKPRPSGIELMRFRVALSFPGERRPYVEGVASRLQNELGDRSVFYDKYFEADLARPNLDIVLQRIYHRNSDLVVVFLCEDYAEKEWCGLEWRAVRDIIKQNRSEKIMLLRFDNALIPGLFGIDGYIDINRRSPSETAEAIVARLRSTRKTR